MANAINNRLDLALSKDEEELVKRGAALYRTTYLDTIDNIFVIARAMEVFRTRNYGTGVHGGYAEALVQYSYTARDGSAMHKTLRSNFKTLLVNEERVRRRTCLRTRRSGFRSAPSTRTGRRR